MLGEHSVSRSLFDRQERICSVHLVLIADDVIEVRVTVAIQLRQRLVLTDPIPPVSFRLCEMAKQSKQ